MKFSSVTSLLSFLSAANALPAVEVQERDVSNAPINFYGAPDQGTSLKCGQNTYSGHDIYLAAQYGVNLDAAGETRGKNKYPHAFDHNDSKGNNLNFDSKTCPENDKARKEYPLKVNGLYDGGKNNVNQGDERVVYYYEEGEIDFEGNPQVYYCGIMTHKGAPTGGFLMC